MCKENKSLIMKKPSSGSLHHLIVSNVDKQKPTIFTLKIEILKLFKAVNFLEEHFSIYVTEHRSDADLFVLC